MNSAASFASLPREGSARDEPERFYWLFHCTPASNLDTIERDGLDPARSKWASAVYLASDEAHAWGYDRHHGQEASVMLAIRVADLDMERLSPDDQDLPDCLEEAEGLEGAGWIDSLLICGQCRHEGVISPTAIFRKTLEGWMPLAVGDAPCP